MGRGFGMYFSSQMASPISLMKQSVAHAGSGTQKPSKIKNKLDIKKNLRIQNARVTD